MNLFFPDQCTLPTSFNLFVWLFFLQYQLSAGDQSVSAPEPPIKAGLKTGDVIVFLHEVRHFDLALMFQMRTYLPSRNNIGHLADVVQGQPLVPHTAGEEDGSGHIHLKLGDPADTASAHLEIINQVSIPHAMSICMCDCYTDIFV